MTSTRTFLVVVINLKTGETFYVSVPGVKPMGELLQNLDEETYIINSISVLHNEVDFTEFLNKNKNRLDDLEFGI